MSKRPMMNEPDPSKRDPEGIGNFHKTMAHDKKTGLVDETTFSKFNKITQDGDDFNDVVQAPGASPLINPQAGWAREETGPDPRSLTMPPPPDVGSDAAAVEMTELFWMALLRDIPFTDFETNNDVKAATAELQKLFTAHKTEFRRMDLPLSGVTPGPGMPPIDKETVNITAKTIFRSGLPGEEFGPLVSQFFLNDIAYGTQIISQKQFPYLAGQNYLRDWAAWLRAQDTGLDEDGNNYPSDNTNATPTQANPSPTNYYDSGYHSVAGLKPITTMRHLARFVNKDALHQAYFNAAIQLTNWRAGQADGNTYTDMTKIKKQIPFGTLGAPHLLSLVSEVADRALKVVWRQKWRQYLRHRPEAYAGLMEAARNGLKTKLPAFVFDTVIAKRMLNGFDKHNNLLLPMAFSAGSPAHPAYGAGHACVAGACVTILKAWFRTEDAKTGKRVLFKDVFANAKDPTFGTPLAVQPMGSTDADAMTLEGELNKLASNVAMGRSMGGVHWRTDNTRSLRLGEKVATIILRRQSGDYQEKPKWAYRNFDGNLVRIGNDGTVTVAADKMLEGVYNSPAFAPLPKYEVFDDVIA